MSLRERLVTYTRNTGTQATEIGKNFASDPEIRIATRTLALKVLSKAVEIHPTTPGTGFFNRLKRVVETVSTASKRVAIAELEEKIRKIEEKEKM